MYVCMYVFEEVKLFIRMKVSSDKLTFNNKKLPLLVSYTDIIVHKIKLLLSFTDINRGLIRSLNMKPGGRVKKNGIRTFK